MMHIEAQDFIDREMRTRWPDWEPTTAQIADWVQWLLPHGVSAALDAVRQHAAESRWKVPTPKDILAALKPRTARPFGRNADERPIPTTCLVLTDPGYPPVGRRGWLFELVTCDADGRKIDDDAGRIACATAYVQRFFGRSGARFDIFLDAAQARRRRTELMDAPPTATPDAGAGFGVFDFCHTGGRNDHH